MILHKYQTEETCLRLYKSISGALFTSATRWSRSRGLMGVVSQKRGVVSKILRGSRAIIILSPPLLKWPGSAPGMCVCYAD